MRAWDEIAEIKNKKTIVDGYVVEENKGGVIVNVLGIRVFVPARQTGLSKDEPLSKLLKTKVKLHITEVNSSRRRVVGSMRSVMFDGKREVTKKIWDDIEQGKKYKGVVKSMTSYGAFVDIGGVDGMVHISEITWNHINHPSEVLKIGETIDVYVLSFDKEKGKISLGCKLTKENPMQLFLEKYKVSDIVPVKIVKFMPFGAFAEIIPGVDGLIHISQIVNRRIGKPDEVLTLNEIVQAKITEIEPDKKRISLSIRAIEEDGPAVDAEPEIVISEPLLAEAEKVEAEPEIVISEPLLAEAEKVEAEPEKSEASEG